jgi:hypothetical protein
MGFSREISIRALSDPRSKGDVDKSIELLLSGALDKPNEAEKLKVGDFF